MKHLKITILTFTFYLLSISKLIATPEELAPIKINNKVYMHYGNVGVIIGEEQVVLIDSWLGTFEEKANENVAAAVKTITDKPIKYVINTHSHGDHSGGNQFFANQGATVISHQNAQYSPYVASAGVASPILRFNQSFSLDIGNEQLQVEHLVAHTFDDAFIYLKNSNLLFVGDNLATNRWISLGVYGMESFNTWTDKALSIMDDNTQVIPGHGATLINKKQLLTHKVHVKAWVERIRILYEQGLSVDEITADTTTAKLKQKLIFDEDFVDTAVKNYEIEGLIRKELNRPLTISTEKLTDFVGRYQFDERNDIEVIIESDKLLARQRNKFYTFLKPLANDQFELTSLNRGEQFTFQRTKSGKVVGSYANHS